MSLKRILIVEDDSDTRLAYHILLKVKHYETFFAKDPLSCLWEAHKNRPDLITMDIGLTAGDGFRAMAQLKSADHLAKIPVIVVSGLDIQMLKERALQSGAIAYFQKPFEQDKFLQTITQLIGNSSEEGARIYPMNARRLAQINT
jgi:CheY-like chemotaxis protein